MQIPALDMGPSWAHCCCWRWRLAGHAFSIANTLLLLIIILSPLLLIIIVSISNAPTRVFPFLLLIKELQEATLYEKATPSSCWKRKKDAFFHTARSVDVVAM